MRSFLTLSLLAILLAKTVYSVDNCIVLSEKTSLNDAKPTIFNISDDNYDGVITSPGYRDHTFAKYPLNILCRWSLESPKGTQIRIAFDDFQLEKCPNDVLQVLDNHYKHLTNSTQIISLCGNSIPSPIISRGNTLNLIFISDQKKTYQGFRLHFKIDSLNDKNSECDSHQFKCRNNKCIKRNLVCNKRDDCTDGTDENNCRYKFNKWYPKCGLPKIEPILGNEEYIIGGRTAIRGSWPFVASLRLRDRHSCGAVLINHQWVVSAAHCFLIQRNTTFWSLTFAKHFRDKHESQETIRYIDKIIFHPKYLPLYDQKYSNRKDYDIALAKLNAPLFFNNYSVPICLPKYSHLRVGSLCHVIGWGEDFNPESDGALKQAEVPIVSDHKCIQDYKDMFHIDTKVMMCAGYSNGGHDSCYGDSGGPLVYSIGKRWYLAGIVSSGYAYDCGNANYPGIYTKVAPFVKWINEVIDNN